MKRELTNCKHCGKIRKKSKSHSWAKYLSRHFCSQRCGALHQYRNGMSDEQKKAISESMKGKPSWNTGMAMVKECICCGKEFKAKGKRLRKIAKFCSMNCRSEYSYKNKDEKKIRYYKEVWKLTKQQPLETLENSDKRGRIDLMENAYNLDHIIPIIYGYENNIPPHEIADISNLQFIPAIDNHRKNRKING